MISGSHRCNSGFRQLLHTHTIDQQLSEEEARLEKDRKRQIEQNRNRMKRLMDITLFLAKQVLAFRGHHEESSSKGNFIVTAELFSNYDETMESHLSNVKQERLKRKEDRNSKGKKKTKRGRRDVVTFISAESQKKIIDIVGNEVMEMV